MNEGCRVFATVSHVLSQRCGRNLQRISVRPYVAAMDSQKRRREDMDKSASIEKGSEEVQLRTRLTDPEGVWKVRVPLVSAPMAGAAGGALVVSRLRILCVL